MFECCHHCCQAVLQIKIYLSSRKSVRLHELGQIPKELRCTAEELMYEIQNFMELLDTFYDKYRIHDALAFSVSVLRDFREGILDDSCLTVMA